MAAKGWFSSWPESRVMAGFCTIVLSCILILVLFDMNSSIRFVLPCEDCRQLGSKPTSPEAIARASLDEHMRHIVTEIMANLSSILKPSGENPQSASSVLEVGVIEEWQLPAVTNDRPHEKLDHPETYGQARRFKPIGSGAFLFVQFGAYRGGPNTFAVVGLGTKGLHKHGNPGFECSYVSNSNSTTVDGVATKYNADWDYGRQYTVVVVNCTFAVDVGVDGSGGRLEVVANHGTLDHTGLPDVRFVALTEEPNTYDGSLFSPPYRYDYLYCGSPIYGTISPQRMREWIAYHVRLFGPRSHFIIYDAGGIDGDVRKVLRPWMELGYITIMNIRQEARYDVYYFSQFLVNSDCVFQAKTLAKWAFFFDVDEYVYVPDYLRFEEVMVSYDKMGRKAQQLVFKQNFMNHNHCRRENLSSQALQRQWGFEKLVYKCTEDAKDIKGFSNKKYAVQAQYALDAGVHKAQHTLVPERTNYYDTVVHDSRLMYYHYHSTISRRSELCEEFLNVNTTRILNATHVLDTSMVALANAVREFENRTIGPQPFLV
ncbi:unnamed protein product [Calypogeia fissa]